MNQTVQIEDNQLLFQDIKQLIDETRSRVATNVNSAITVMYWHIGTRINNEVLGHQRAEYGKQIVANLSSRLKVEYGQRGFDEKSIRRMMQFAQIFPDFEIVAPAARQLSWSHIVEVLPLKEELEREFYLTMAVFEHWSRNTLRSKIDSLLYQRTLLSGKPEEIIKETLSKIRVENSISPDVVFKNPYFLDFTGLRGCYSEKSLEDSLVARLEQFIMELGAGFTFVERQKRMVIDGEDFYLDLLFYHRKLRRLIAIELKLGRFKAAHKGQMELYLRWLEKYATEKGEETPLGLILCSDGGREQIELLQLDSNGIKVAQYFTELPDKKLLEEQLHKELEIAKAQFSSALENE
jgi:predicted nuclease of restriction endonuclease-like (RecB) superfamily